MKAQHRVQAIDASAPRLERSFPDGPVRVINLMRLMRAANQALTSYFDDMLRPLGFTESTLHTLLLLFALDGGAAAPGTLCDLVGQTKANMTRILSVLSKRRYVTRRTDATDGRRQKIEITDKGRELVREMLPRVSAPLSRAVEQLTLAEQNAFDLLLRKLIASLSTSQARLNHPG